MTRPGPNEGPAAIGQAWLRRKFGLRVPAPAVESYIVQGARRTAVHGSRTFEFYPRQYETDQDVASHLRFALRHEPIDLGVLVAALKAMAPADLESWVRAEPTGAYSRRAWFFYETFTGRTLDIEDTRTGNYVEALDPERHIVADRRNSARHRVIDNLLGGIGLCPWAALMGRMVNGAIDPVVAAAVTSFAFVFTHPFADGNGRIHRFLMHHVLAKSGYSPAGRRDLKEELGFVAVFDRAFAAVREIVDMPDRRASLFVRLCMQNGGRLATVNRPQFQELSDAEIALLEAQVQQVISAETVRHS